MKRVIFSTKTTAAVIAAAMLFIGCAKGNDTAENGIPKMQSEVSADSQSETSADVSESIETESFKLPDDLFCDNNREYMIAQLDDGTLKKISFEEYEAFAMGKMLEMMLSEDYYNEYIADDDYDPYGSYDEYKNQVLEWYGEYSIDNTEDSYSCIYSIMGSFGDEEPDYDKAASAVFGYVLRKIEQNSYPFFENNDDFKLVTIEYEAKDGALLVYAGGNSDSDRCEIASAKYITFDGEEMFSIGTRPIAADTKSIYISVYDEITDPALFHTSSDGYDAVIYGFGQGYDEERIVDIAKLAENFPDLEKLSLSSHIEISEPAELAKLSDLKELRLDVEELEDISFLSQVKAKKIGLTGVCRPVDVLSKLDLKEITIECTPYEGVLESIYKLKNVTELTINRYSKTEPFFTGIENLTELKRLDISVDPDYTADLAPLAKLQKAEDLSILAYYTKNLDKIADMKSVKKLMLHSMEDDDLSFLSDMTQLEELSLYYVNSSYGPSLQYLDNVKKLFIADTVDGADMSRIYQMKNLENLALTGERFTPRGIGQLKKLNTLGIMLCSYSDLSGLKNCGALENLTIYNCLTPQFNAKDIEGMTKLKTLSFNCSEISSFASLKTLTGLEEMRLYFCNLSSGDINELEQALPNCNIDVDN